MTGIHTRTYQLPHGYTAEFFHSPGRLEVRWLPDVPHIREARHRRKFFEAYQAARRDFIKEVAVLIGGNILIVDTDEQVTTEAIHAPARH
jgi:hypothetical protein